MSRVAAVLIVTLLAASCISLGDAENPPAEEPRDTTSVANLLLEIEALQLFRQLGLSPEQLAQLRVLAKETAEPPQPRPAEPKVGDQLRKTARELHAALLTGDHTRIDELGDRLIELREAEMEPLGDDYEMTEAAREQAPKLLRALAPAQVAAFIGALADSVPDPLEAIVDSLGQVRDMKNKDWESFREGLAEDMGRLIAGLDPDKAGECGDKVIQLLIISRSLSDEEFKQRKPDLEKKAAAIVGDVGPIDILRNEVEFRLAEMLSNPRLEAALALRLK